MLYWLASARIRASQSIRRAPTLKNSPIEAGRYVFLLVAFIEALKPGRRAALTSVSCIAISSRRGILCM